MRAANNSGERIVLLRDVDEVLCDEEARGSCTVEVKRERWSAGEARRSAGGARWLVGGARRSAGGARWLAGGARRLAGGVR